MSKTFAFVYRNSQGEAVESSWTGDPDKARVVAVVALRAEKTDSGRYDFTHPENGMRCNCSAYDLCFLGAGLLSGHELDTLLLDWWGEWKGEI